MIVTDFNIAQHLETEEDIVAFLSESFKSGNADYIAHAIGIIARAHAMTALSRKTGIAREQLYRSFSAKGNPTLKTTLAVLNALNIRLCVSHSPNIS